MSTTIRPLSPQVRKKSTIPSAIVGHTNLLNHIRAEKPKFTSLRVSINNIQVVNKRL